MYNFENNPFYNLQSIEDFFNIIGIEKKSSIGYLCSDKLYNIIKIDNNKPFQVPIKILASIHNKTKIILSDIELPDNVFAPATKGKKKSSITHAQFHKNSRYLLAMDIKSFFENIDIRYIIKFFNNSLKIEYKTACTIAKILTYNNHIARGSSVSPILAHLSIYKIVEKINKYCIDRNILFSIYMDDIILSSENKFDFNKAISFVKKNLSLVNLNINYKKLRRYNYLNDKRVTGIIITKNNNIKIPNKNRKKIIEKLNYVEKYFIKVVEKNKINNDELKKELQSINGIFNYLEQIEDNFLKSYKENIIEKCIKIINDKK
ncbi:reverse transcriptase domain-containing protein [Brachyspira murdochii]|uniref:reverse transcriptase domain-containing protein n=1 Tax=Brachyspira murdochii TaxID=84378 RepID=UPI0030071B2E